METRERSTFQTTQRPMLVAHRHSVTEPENFYDQLGPLNASLSYRGQYVLTFHALELALKSFLAGCGVSDVELRNKYAHDLDKLYEEARKHGLTLNDPHAARLIKDANQQHEKSLLRYLLEHPQFVL